MGGIKNTVRYLRKNSTDSEQVFWVLVRRKKFHDLRFQRQYPIKYIYYGNSSFFVADFYCHKYNLIIEIDGNIHNKTKDRDKIRDHIVKEYGFRVLRFKAKDIISKPKETLKQIEKFLGL